MIAMILMTAGILGWLVYRQRNLFHEIQWEFRPVPLLLSLAFYSLSLFQVVAVWGQAMNALGGRTDFQKHFRFLTISLPARRLPGTIWYIPWRGKMYESVGISLRMVSIAGGVELALTVISGILMSAIFAIPILSKYRIGLWIGLFLLLISLLVLHPATIHKIGSWLKVELNQIRYISILYWVGQYALFWITSGVMLFFVINIIYPLPFEQISYVIGAWTLTNTLAFALVLLPSNLGFTEVSLSLLLSLIIPSPVAVFVAVGTRILLIFYELIWAAAMALLDFTERRRLTP